MATPSPGTSSSPAPADGSGPFTLDHWVYGVTPGRGYSIKSVSRGLNLSFYDSVIAEHYTPIRGESLQDGLVNLIMVHPAPSGTELLFSVVGRGPDDELGRPTFANHTAVVPVDRLRTGVLTMESVEQAIRLFDQQHANALGEIEPLPVALGSAGPVERAGQGIRRCLTPAAAETLASRWATSPTGRTLLLTRNSTSEQRIRTLRLLLGTLCLAGGLPWPVAMSDAPTASAMDHFQLVIAPRGVRADNTWVLLDASLDRPALPRAGGQDALYGALGRCFALE